MIRATLAVVPSRLPVLWAKLIVLVGVVLPLSLLAGVAEFFVATALESSRGGSAISLTDPGVLREVVGASLYLAVIAVIGLALGALIRRTAAGLSVFAAVFFVVPIVAAYLPHSITGFVPYLPSNAGGAVWGAGKLFGGHQLGPWNGFAALCGYAVVLTGLAAWRLRSRDAWTRAKATRIQACPSGHHRSRTRERAPLRSRAFDVGDRPARRGGVVQRGSYSAEETAPELTVLRRSAARTAPSMGNP